MNKRYIFIPFLLLVCNGLFFSCEKNEQDSSFKGEAKIFFAPHQLSDSLVYSFANFPAADSRELLLPLQIMGNTAGHDRVVEVVVEQQGTTATTEEYQLIQPIVIPAGATTTSARLRIVNSPRLESEKIRLSLALQSSSDFRVDPAKPDKINEMVTFNVIWSNILVQPADWPTAQWGGYSVAKHRLVIELTGYTEYSGSTWVAEGLTFRVMGVCNDWLEAYNAAHPSAPYQDEHGNVIRFCPTCH